MINAPQTKRFYNTLALISHELLQCYGSPIR
jgi:hypothetical protein